MKLSIPLFLNTFVFSKAFVIPTTTQYNTNTNKIIISSVSAVSAVSESNNVEEQEPSLIVAEEDDNKEEEETQAEKEFKLRTKQLCNERNLPLQKVKNARDLASVKNSLIQPNRIIRTGRVSDATMEDLDLLQSKIGIKTLVDLRSYTELKDDPTLDRKEVFGDYVDLVWDERKDDIKVLNEGRSRVETKKNIVGHVKELVGGAKRGVDVATHFRNETTISSSDDDMSNDDDDDAVVDGSGLLKVLSSAAELADVTEACVDDIDDDDDDNDDSPTTIIENTHIDEDLADGEKVYSSSSSSSSTSTTKKRFMKIYHNRNDLISDTSRAEVKERHFVSIMNELKYVIGTLSKVRKRDLAKALIKSPGAIVSKRVRSSCKDVFLDRINGGGLHMLNELLLKQGAPGIKYVLDLCKDRSRHPIAFYCTAGKDRTGMIAAIMLAAAGVADEDIVEDYSLSANVYAEMNDHKAMVGALSQRNLDAKTFLGAPPEVMRDTLVNIRSTYGSIEGYLDYIGFTEEDRMQLKSALLDE